MVNAPPHLHPTLTPTPHATHTVTPRTQVHHHHLTPTPKTPHPHHTPPTPRTRIHRTPRQQRTPEAPSRQPPPTPITTPTKNLTHHPPTGTDQRSPHQHDPLRHAHEHTTPRHPPRPTPSTRTPHSTYVHNLRNAHTEPPFRTYTRHRNHRSSTPPQEHTAPSEHHAPTDNKAPSYPTQKPPQPPKTHPKEATTPTSPIPTQVSQRTPLLDPEGQATPGPKPEGLTTTHAQHTAHPRKEDPPPEAQPSRPVAPPPEGRLHETRDPTYNTRNLRHPVRPPRQDPLHHRHPLSTPVTTYTLSHCGFLARVLNTQRDPYGHLG